ncbi:hypothetical protein ACHWQZ_G014084 [Mnemiopsis leidyi]
MAAAANHTSCVDATLETFTLSNAVPQFPACNRGNWKILENYARSLVKTSVGVYVYSGPLFIPQQAGQSRDQYVVYQVIGEHTVAVPTHFFKIIVVERVKEKARVECFLVENAPAAKSLTLQDMYVGLGDVEKWSGLLTTVHSVQESTEHVSIKIRTDNPICDKFMATPSSTLLLFSFTDNDKLPRGHHTGM